GHGLEDYAVGIKNHLPIISPVTADARYSKEAGKYEGIKVPDDANAAIIKDLELDGSLIKNGSISHSYPHCWRCDTKVIYIATPQWFFNIQKIKSKLLSENSKVSWHPKEAMNWQSDVLKSAPDWCISRQRYWDIPIPIWECKNCGAFHAVGSLEELKELSLEPEIVPCASDLHRPHIDMIHIKCPKCTKVMDRIPDVFDVWFDSGIAFRASLTDEEFERLFPIDYIVEGKDQLRGWFSALLRISVLAYGKKPYKDIGVDGMLLDSEGREMHKKLGNYVPISEFLKNSSADSFRLWSVQHTPWLDIRLKMNEVKDAERTIVIMHNISNLIGEYEQLLGYKPKVKSSMSIKQLEAEEQWLISRLESTVSEVTSCLESYEVYKGMAALSNFITEDFSRFYLKIAKRKLSTQDKHSAKRVLGVMEYVLYKSNTLLSVATPFTSEKIYLERYGSMESIFMEKWPKANARNINHDLEKSFSVVKDAITATLNSRERANIPLKLPLQTATFELNSDEAFRALRDLSPIVESYCNIRKINISESASSVEEIRPAFNRLGPDFKQDAQAIADALKNVNPEELDSSVEKLGHYDLHTDKGIFSIRQEHYTKVKKAIESNVTLFRYGKVSINTDISEEMREEAFIRELIHKLQMMRKEAGLKKADRIRLYYDVMESSDAIVMKNLQTIKKSLNATLISKLKNGHDGVKEIDVQGETFKVVIEGIKKEG
ncbi:class I tRNA ligase family protein, partial [Candidatus Marsarchaeota archaeon]|nr:class I tRNA ligase family protein [Candidatus Marsarchaeota archaeon]